MREDNRGALWLIVAVAAVAAVVFIVLWFMRGGEIDVLKRDLQQARRSGEETAARLDGEIAALRSDLSSASTKLSETESFLRSERRRADLAEAEASRVPSSEAALAEAQDKLSAAEEKLKAEASRGADASSKLEEALNALAATRDRVAGLEQTNRELGGAWDKIADLEQSIASERERASDLNRQLMASATVIASAESDAAAFARINGDLAETKVRLAEAEKTADAEKRRAAEFDARLARSAAALQEAEGELERQRNASELLIRTEVELADALAEIERLRTPGAEVGEDDGDSMATINIMLRQQRERAEQAHGRAAEVGERLKALEVELEEARFALAASNEKAAADVRSLTQQVEDARREIETREQASARTESRFEELFKRAGEELAEKTRSEDEARAAFQAQIAKLREDLVQANRTREEITTELRGSYEKRLLEGREAAESVRGRLTEMEGREQAAARLRDNLHEQLAAAQKALTDQKQASGAALAGIEKQAAAAARLRANLQEQLAAAQKASAENLARLVQTRNELEAERQASETRRLGLESQLAESGRVLEEREQAARKARNELNAELAALGSTISSLETRVGELQGEVGEYADVFGARKPREVLGEMTARQDRIKALGAELDSVQYVKANLDRNLSDIQARLDRYVVALEGDTPEMAAARIDTLEGLLDDLEATLARYNETLEGEPPEAVMALQRRLEATVDNYREAFGLERPGRFVGEIVDAMDHNRTLVINLGAKDRVKAGMKFDVHRKAGDRNRYIGMVQVIRVYEDTALAVATLRKETVMVCPATGFAVLEPGARFSPFATGEDGEPLPLVEDGSLDVMTEAPGIGDFINSPFYDRGKQLVFAVENDAFANSGEGRKLIETMGGVPKTWEPAMAADFLVVSGDAGEKPVEGGWENHPARVTPAFLARYCEPLAVIPSPPPPPCPAPDCR